jgi:hypothetical protein
MSGSGKTYSALQLGYGFAGSWDGVGLVDTESGRASVYADLGPWRHMDLAPPFAAERYVEALDVATDAGLRCLIVDSFSHEWDGEGGVLDQAAEQEEAGRTGLLKWARPKGAHKRLVQALLRTRIPLVVVCMRGKRRLRQVGSGRSAQIVDDGIVPIQDDRLIYEMSATLSLIGEGRYETTKATLPLRPILDGSPLSAEVGRRLREWTAMPSVDLDAARVAADGGVVAFRSWWQARSKVEQDALRPHIGELRERAEAVAAPQPQLKAGEDEVLP